MKTSDFTTRVYAIAAQIPKGKVATYGQLAKAAGNPKAARAVGMAMRTNPNRKHVPCHRVVASTGALTGYAFGKGIATKMRILKKEGVQFRGNRVDLSASLWKG
jgi:O-6-methylguanine DNA methyltransferase